MSITIITHLETLLILPLLSVEQVLCENDECGETHGFGVVIGWLLWEVAIYIPV